MRTPLARPLVWTALAVTRSDIGLEGDSDSKISKHPVYAPKRKCPIRALVQSFYTDRPEYESVNL